MRCKLCDGPCLIFKGKYWKCEHCDELYEITEQLDVRVNDPDKKTDKFIHDTYKSLDRIIDD